MARQFMLEDKKLVLKAELCTGHRRRLGARALGACVSRGLTYARPWSLHGLRIFQRRCPDPA
eukprot:4393794-Alexandrium_andersonii.AAC.1